MKPKKHICHYYYYYADYYEHCVLVHSLHYHSFLTVNVFYVRILTTR